MTTTNWTGAAKDGSWFTAGNWSGGVPRAGEATAFAGGSFGTISLAGARHAVCGALTVQHARLTLAGGMLQLSPPAGQNQDLTVNGSAFGIASGAGVSGAGTFTFGNAARVLDMGLLSDQDGFVLGSHALVHVSGAGAVWTSTQFLYVGAPDGSAELVVDKGATVSAGGSIAIGQGSAVVSGAHSLLSTSTLEVGNSVEGFLTIENGGTVTASFASTVGDGQVSSVVLTGAGSTWNAGSLLIGDGPMQAGVTASNGATLNAADTSIAGSLILDGTVHAHLGAYLELEGGTIIAAPPPGHASGPDVTISANVNLFGGSASEPLFGNLQSLPGARLIMAGQFTEGAVLTSNVAITGGDVVLTNPTNQISEVRIDSATLDLAATGAGGGTLIVFSEDSGVLRLEAGVSVPEKIGGFQFSGQLIDFAGILSGPNTGATYTPDGSGGGTLTVTDGTHSTSLVLTDYHNPNDFFLGTDRQGGTTIYYQGPTHG